MLHNATVQLQLHVSESEFVNAKRHLEYNVQMWCMRLNVRPFIVTESPQESHARTKWSESNATAANHRSGKRFPSWIHVWDSYLFNAQVQQQQQPTQIQIVSADRIRFSCEECGLTFNTQSDLKSHKIQTHQQQQVTQATQQQQPQNTLKIKNCESCGAPLPQDNNKKRAVMKVKCENCLNAEAIQPQIFVVATAPDTATVKFEESTGTQTQTNLGWLCACFEMLSTWYTILIFLLFCPRYSKFHPDWSEE